MFSLLIDMLRSQAYEASSDELTPLHIARRFIDENYETQITYAMLNERCGLSQSQLVEGFRTWLNCTPAKYLQQIRLSAAEHLMENSDLPLAEISLRSGFSEQSAFTHCLTRAYGISPAASRRAVRLSRTKSILKG